MSSNTHVETVRLALENVLGRSILSIDEGTVSADVQGWDSLANVRLLIEIEMNQNIRFNVAEVESLPNVGALAALIADKKVG